MSEPNMKIINAIGTVLPQTDWQMGEFDALPRAEFQFGSFFSLDDGLIVSPFEFMAIA
jgi:hypothetical protein